VPWDGGVDGSREYPLAFEFAVGRTELAASATSSETADVLLSVPRPVERRLAVAECFIVGIDRC
jgi:hypothetical protein